MSWIKVNEELYQNDVAPFILQKINTDWFIVDLRDKSKAISFNDIFNNPVESLSIFLSNLDLTVKSLISIGSISGDSLLVTNSARAKHFRGDQSNDPSTPSFSSQSDNDTGFYHVASGKFGFSSNSVKKGEIGEFGFLNGTLNSDFRNLIKTQTIEQVFNTAYVIPSTATTKRAIGYNFTYTPIQIGSKLKIFLSVPCGVASLNNLLVFLYKTSSPLSNGGTISGGNYLNPIDGIVACASQQSANNISLVVNFNNYFEFISDSLSLNYFNVILQITNANTNATFNIAHPTLNKVTIEEYV